MPLRAVFGFILPALESRAADRRAPDATISILPASEKPGYVKQPMRRILRFAQNDMYKEHGGK